MLRIAKTLLHSSRVTVRSKGTFHLSSLPVGVVNTLQGSAFQLQLFIVLWFTLYCISWLEGKAAPIPRSTANRLTQRGWPWCMDAGSSAPAPLPDHSLVETSIVWTSPLVSYYFLYLILRLSQRPAGLRVTQGWPCQDSTHGGCCGRDVVGTRNSKKGGGSLVCVYDLSSYQRILLVDAKFIIFVTPLAEGSG